jgi:ribosome-binding factor A
VLSRGDLNDPALDGTIVTVPEVRVSNDLKMATCYIMPLGGKNADAVVAALDTHRKYLRGEVSRRMEIKFAVDLKFVLDTSFAEAARIDALLRHDPIVRQDIETARDDDTDEE